MNEEIKGILARDYGYAVVRCRYAFVLVPADFRRVTLHAGEEEAWEEALTQALRGAALAERLKGAGWCVERDPCRAGRWCLVAPDGTVAAQGCDSVPEAWEAGRWLLPERAS